MMTDKGTSRQGRGEGEEGWQQGQDEEGRAFGEGFVDQRRWPRAQLGTTIAKNVHPHQQQQQQHQHQQLYLQQQQQQQQQQRAHQEPPQQAYRMQPTTPRSSYFPEDEGRHDHALAHLQSQQRAPPPPPPPVPPIGSAPRTAPPPQGLPGPARVEAPPLSTHALRQATVQVRGGIPPATVSPPTAPSPLMATSFWKDQGALQGQERPSLHMATSSSHGHAQGAGGLDRSPMRLASKRRGHATWDMGGNASSRKGQHPSQSVRGHSGHEKSGGYAVYGRVRGVEEKEEKDEGDDDEHEDEGEEEEEEEDLLAGAPGADDQRFSFLKDTQERLLPLSNVHRSMRNWLSANAKISDSSKALMQECASEFVSFITSEAADRCAQSKRKVLTCEDLLDALGALGFEHMVEPLSQYMTQCRETVGMSKRAQKRGNVPHPQKRARQAHHHPHGQQQHNHQHAHQQPHPHPHYQHHQQQSYQPQPQQARQQLEVNVEGGAPSTTTSS